MVTVALDALPLRDFLDKKIPELEAQHRSDVEALKEAAVSRRRGERHMFFGKRKSDKDLWVEALTNQQVTLPDFDYIHVARRIHMACFLSVRSNMRSSQVTVTEEEVVDLLRIGYGK